MLTVKRLTDECYETLKEMLTRCEIKPGDRFTEKSLIEQTGFGRMIQRQPEIDGFRQVSKNLGPECDVFFTIMLR